MQRVKFLFNVENPDRISFDRYVTLFKTIPEPFQSFAFVFIMLFTCAVFISTLPTILGWILANVLRLFIFDDKMINGCQSGHFRSCWIIFGTVFIGTLFLTMVLTPFYVGYLVVKNAYKTPMEISTIVTTQAINKQA